MPQQNLRKITRTADDPDYWAEYAAKLLKRGKTRGAAEVALKMEARGKAGVTPEIRSVLDKVVALARGA